MMDFSEGIQPLVELPVPFRPVMTLFQLEEMRRDSEEKLQVLDSLEKPALAWEQGNLAGIIFALGDGGSALEFVQRGLENARLGQQKSLYGYLSNTLGAILCYLGRYREGETAFARAEMIFSETGDTLGMAWQQHLYAREYARDRRNFAEASAQLNLALPVLRSRANPQVMIENMLTQTDCAIQQGELRLARDFLDQIESMITEQKCYWHRPELHLLKARLSTLEQNYRRAWQDCYTGLGTIGDYGDLRMLSALYLALGTALEHDRGRIDDAQDALGRAIEAGRTRARRLHLALALRQMGLHLRRFSNRPTVRARGSGFLFEADRLLQEMDLADLFPGNNASPPTPGY